MNIFEKMDAQKNKYTKTELLIYENVKKMPKNFSDAPIPEITRIYSFSQPSLTRFAKKLGFDGFLRFQYQLKNDLSNNTATDNSSRAEFYGSFMKLVEKVLKMPI